MFKSVFQKIFFTYLSILILIMLVLSITISSLADNYVYNEKCKVLESVAFKTNSAANSFSAGELSQSQLTDEISTMGYITNTKIYIVKSSITDQIGLEEELGDNYLKAAINKVLSGESVVLRKQYSASFDAQMLFAAYPWKNGSTIKGAILLFSPEKEIASITGDVRLIISLTAAAFVLIGGIIIYFFSRRISKPIKAIDVASRKMSQGEPVKDISIHSKDELGNLARSFNNMKRKLSKNEELRQNLIANISHDLRTPITNINGFASGMADGIIKPEDYPKYTEIIRQEAKRLMNLTSEILDSAKIQSGNIELNISQCKLSQLVQSAIDANELSAAEKEIQIIKDYDESLNLYADPKKIEQVLFNLVNNAFKYSNPRGIVVISARQSEKEAEICVKDEGTGILEKDLPYIFERYYRAESTQGKTGFGLGLCIAKTYVEAHGGTINVQSIYGAGTRICFTLPNP